MIHYICTVILKQVHAHVDGDDMSRLGVSEIQPSFLLHKFLFTLLFSSVSSPSEPLLPNICTLHTTSITGIPMPCVILKHYHVCVHHINIRKCTYPIMVTRLQCGAFCNYHGDIQEHVDPTMVAPNIDLCGVHPNHVITQQLQCNNKHSVATSHHALIATRCCKVGYSPQHIILVMMSL